MISYVDQIWWRLLKIATCIACQTDRQTDKHSVKRTYLPNFFQILASNKHKSCCKFHTWGNYSLDLVNANQLHNWKESHCIMLQSPCKHFPFKKVFFLYYFGYRQRCRTFDITWERSFAPYSFRLNRRMSSLPYKTWKSSTFRVLCSWRSHLYW